LADRARLARGTKSIDLTMFFTGKSLLKVKPLPETPTLIDILHGSAGARLAWASKFRLAATLNSPRHASNELRTSQKSLKIPQTTKGKVKRRRPLLSAETIFDCASIFSTTLSSRIPIFTTNIARQRTGVALQMKLRPRKSPSTPIAGASSPLAQLSISYIRRTSHRIGEAAFENAVQLAELGSEILPHTLRHTAAAWLMQRGSMAGRGRSGHVARHAAQQLWSSPPSFICPTR
jgi:hypothetical protein